jgi:hypothetical protein
MVFNYQNFSISSLVRRYWCANAGTPPPAPQWRRWWRCARIRIRSPPSLIRMMGHALLGDKMQLVMHRWMKCTNQMTLYKLCFRHISTLHFFTILVNKIIMVFGEIYSNKRLPKRGNNFFAYIINPTKWKTVLFY